MSRRWLAMSSEPTMSGLLGSMDIKMNQAVVEALMGYTNACACSKLMFTRRESGRLY
jgi:hypothetical protein